MGSPPQVRGKHFSRADCSPRTGITPAGAGKTFCHHKTEDCGWDHPRRCGENDGKWGKKSQFAGSPPQVRGKREDRRNAQTVSGITPAGAGKTSIGAFCPNVPRDHPRRCGENIINGNSDYNIEGSPPQVRGKHRLKACESPNAGITPAGAGKTAERA